MIKQLPDGRWWVEFYVTEKQYQELINQMCEVGAPDLSALFHYASDCLIAEHDGKPVPPMPWKEDKQTLLPVTNAPILPRAMPYSPARRYDAESTGTRDRLRQMVAVKRQIELELIDFAEKELMRE